MNDCIFCKIINNELPSYRIYEDEDFLVILDKFPITLAHSIIIPKKHFEDVYGLDNSTGEKIFPLITKISKALKSHLKCEGLNIFQNNGEVAGQSVKHFHVHIIPRSKDDEIKIIPSSKKVTDEDFINVAEALKTEISL